ncbi:hypothetical protein [Vibrio anguillarum]|uniref:hypothetical protein n=1 Tax=Vibrio anguillarum TaxID=55601 RepID=UPI000B5431B4|nr:hypothetical protein [Vibrio anguillarum]ASG04259.1 hypothetical protein CEJ46_10575 [Vibrio anguillarum]
MTIYIEKKEYKAFVTPRMLDGYRISVILLLIDSSISGSTKYIYLDKLHFLFDLLICDQEFVGFPKFTIPPWNIDKELKNILIILTKNNLIEQSYDGNKVRYSLTKKGNYKVEEIKSVDELSLVIEKAEKLATSVKTSAFNKSKVIF